MPSPRPNIHPLPQKQNNAIGDIFREWGEAYIKSYQPPIDHIKFIRAVRVCKTPALGGKVIVCKKCQYEHHVYFSCGHARCPICQSIKREQWMDKMKNILLDVPYVHLVTTMPYSLRRLSKKHPKQMYNLLFRVTKMTVWRICNDEAHLGARPGMVSILHTFGSDLKYHVHVHSLLTFGGISADGQWRYPKHPKRLCRNRKLKHRFREIFLVELKKLFDNKAVDYHESYATLIAPIKQKSWTVFISHPTMNTQTIEKYLARYINRIAVTNSRVQYVKQLKKVHLIYNDYQNQKDGKPAPKGKKVLEPLSFIHQMLMHLPPPYYQRTRRYGLHASSKSKIVKTLISKKARANGRTIRTVLEIITHLMKLNPLKCEKCGATVFSDHHVTPDTSWIFQFITLPKIRGPSCAQPL